MFLPYDIDFTDASKPGINIQPGHVDRSTDVVLIGSGTELWGEKYCDNFLHLLENFASPDDTYDILQVNKIGGATVDNFIINGNHLASFLPSTSFEVFKSTANDGNYTVFSSELIGNSTRVVVTTAIPDGTFDGKMGHIGEPNPNFLQSPIAGQLWYDSTQNILNVYSGSSWSILTSETSLSASNITNDSSVSGTNVDDALDSLLNNTLPLSGGILTGSLTLNSDPVNNFDAATKQYVDNAVDFTKIRQVVSNTTSTVTITNNTSFELTQLVTQITPNNINNKILCMLSGMFSSRNISGTDHDTEAHLAIFRDGIEISKTRIRVDSGDFTTDKAISVPATLIINDTPLSTALVTYEVKIQVTKPSYEARFPDDLSNFGSVVSPATLILMEIEE